MESGRPTLALLIIFLILFAGCATIEEDTLRVAARNGHTKTVKSLINAGSDVNGRDRDGKTALMWAANYGHADTVRALIDSGADVNAQSFYKWTALMLASLDNHTDAVKIL